MTMRTIITEAGFRPCTFPKCSMITVKLYDGKDREKTEEVKYAKELFADNVKSAFKFFNFLCFLEAKPVSSMNVKIDENSVIVFYNTDQAISFKRKKSMESMDYMD